MKGIFELEMAAEPEGENLLLVDCLNLAFRYKHKRQRDFAADFVRTIESFARSYSCGKVILCADKGKSAYRLGIFPEYKGNRDEKFKDQTDEDRKLFAEFLEDFEDALALAKLRYPCLRFQGVEADDIVSVVCKLSKRRVWIISTDRDFDQLVCDRVSRFCYYTRKEITVDNFEAKYDCQPDEYISFKVLAGDAGDNVPGVAQVGAKRAASLIKQYGSALDIYDSLPLPGNQKFIQNINNFGDQFIINYQLMDLGFSEEAVGFENLKEIQELVNEIG